MSVCSFLQLLPGGADLLLNMASVLHDETIFEDPLTFNPQRYLEGDVKLKKDNSLWIRYCNKITLPEKAVETFVAFP